MNAHDPRSRLPLRRREFLIASAATGAAASIGLPVLAPRADAQTRRAKKLIVVLNSGGWDTTYALDPKPGASAVDTPDGDVQMFGALPILTHASRPSVSAFF